MIDRLSDEKLPFKALLRILINNGNPVDELVSITIKDAQYLVEDLEDHKRLYKIDRRTYTYSTYFARNFDKEWLNNFDPDNLTVTDLENILSSMEQQEGKEKLIESFWNGRGYWKLLEEKFKIIFRDGQDVVVKEGATEELMLCKFRKEDACFIRDNGEVYEYNQIYSFVLI